MGAVDVGVGHYDDLVVPHPLRLELRSLARPDGGHQGADFLVGDHLLRLPEHPLDVHDLALEGQDGLEGPVPPILAEPPADSPSTM